MKILCLHGYGTSADILESQLNTFMARADPNIEFIFLEGEQEAPKAQGVGNFVKGPFLCYNAKFSPADIRNSYQLVEEFIEESGPFDGVLGFSQGGSLALTYLMQHDIEHPNEPPPFKFAILFSTVIGFSMDETFGNSILGSLTDKEVELFNKFPNSDLSSLEPLKRAYCETIAKTFESAKLGGFIDPETDSGGFEKRDDPSQPRVYHPEVTSQRIRVPTVHITGKKDHPVMVELSKLMVGLCPKALVKTLVHGGTHDVPRKPEDVRATWQAVDWAIEESQRQSW